MKKNNGYMSAINRIERLLLEHGEVDTITLYDTMKVQKNKNGRTYRNTSTINEMTNILCKNKQFEKCGYTARTKTLLGSSYQVQVWRLRRGSNETQL